MSITFHTATTMNGFLADAANSLDWLFSVDGEGPDMNGFLDSVSVIVMGSTTYQWVLDHENLLSEPHKWAEYFGARPTYVFSSRTLQRPAGVDVRIIAGLVRDRLPEIQYAAGAGNVWVQGGGDLAGQFLDAGALDEIVLSMAPVFLAGGAPLLPRTVLSDRLRLRSVEQVGQFAVVTLGIEPPT